MRGRSVGGSASSYASVYNVLNTENSMGVFGGGGFGGWQRQEGLFLLPFLRVEYRW
ncbi:MAG: hypothetical protein OXG58_10460 [Gemmatimonadetes bacterium]|nr:hypothetical protein [Gemmatimonadota bacterium]MCY3943890.1 hypothetical protein [Gemmatimonadota bacterium]